MKIQNWKTGETIYECSQCRTLKELVEKAVRESISLENANLENVNLRNANLYNADLTNANLENSNLVNADLTNADLENANLENVNLRNANLYNADLTNANLENSNLRYTDLRNANLRNANLRNANLTGARLRNADLRNAKNFHGNNHPNNYMYYSVWHYSNGQYYIHMGCHRRSITEWHKDFWNNDSEFPNDGNEESLKRVEAFNIIREEIKEDATQKNLMTDELQEFLEWEIEVNK